MADRTSVGHPGPARPHRGDRRPSRSRIERFARLVEETGTGRHHRRPVDADAELLALVRMSHRLASVPQPTVPAPFREDLRTRLLAAYAQEHATPEPVARHPTAEPHARLAGVATEPDARLASAAEVTQVVRQVRPRLGRARLAAVIGLASGALAISGVSLASNDAVPGDPLYGVKGISEQAQLVFARSDANRGHLHLDFARSRLVEARQVAPGGVAQVLAEMDREITEGVRLLFTSAVERDEEGPIDSVTTFIAQQRADLLELRAAVRAPDDPARRSLDLLYAVEIRANELRAALAGGCEMTATDRFGPAPAC